MLWNKRFLQSLFRTGAYSRTTTDESFKAFCHDLALHKDLVSLSVRKYLSEALAHEAEKDAAAKSITRNKTSSACAADGYHGAHAAVDVGGKVGRKEVTLVDTMSPEFCVLLLREHSQLAGIIKGNPQGLSGIQITGSRTIFLAGGLPPSRPRARGGGQVRAHFG